MIKKNSNNIRFSHKGCVMLYYVNYNNKAYFDLHNTT